MITNSTESTESIPQSNSGDIEAGNPNRSFHELLITDSQALSKILRLSFPIMVNTFVTNAGSFAVTYYFSQLGERSLAASGLVFSMQLVTLGTAKANLGSTSIVTARNLNDKPKLGEILQQSWTQSIIQSAPLITVLSFSGPIFQSLGQAEEIANIAGSYLSKYNIALPAVLLLAANEQFAIGAKRTKLVLYVNIFNTAFTTGLEYVMAFGTLDSPKLGVDGIAYASAISTWISFLGMTLYFRYDKQFSEYHIFSRQHSNRAEILKALFLVGLPMGLDSLSTFIHMFLRTTMAGWLGETSLAVEQVAVQYIVMFALPILSLATVIGVLINTDIVENRAENIKRLGKMSMLTGLTLSTITTIVFSTAYRPLTTFFVNKDDKNYNEILSLAAPVFIINGVAGLLNTLKTISVGQLRGFFDTRTPMLISSASLLLIGTPLAYGFSFPLELDVEGLFLGTGAALLASAPVLMYRWRTKSNNPKKAVEEGKKSVMTKFFGECFARRRVQEVEEQQIKTNELAEATNPDDILNASFSRTSACNIL